MSDNLPLKILIADDDDDELQYLKFLFDNHKRFEITKLVSSGKDVLDEIMIKNNIPDILVTDMYMPLMTGTEAIEILLEKNAAPNLFIFVISTTINETEAEKFRDNPKIKFLAKPMTLPQINDIPETILEQMNLGNINKI